VAVAFTGADRHGSHGAQVRAVRPHVGKPATESLVGKTVTNSFRDYVLGRKRAYSSAGDFVEKIRKDLGVLNVTTFDELESVLKKRGVPASDLEVARMLWNSYEAKLRGERR
jgi:hypothetical protein